MLREPEQPCKDRRDRTGDSMSNFIRATAFGLGLFGLFAAPAAAAQNACPADQRDSAGHCPIPLHLDRGAYGLAVTGHLTPQHYRDIYSLKVGARQTLVVTFAGAEAMTGEIACGSTGDGPWYGSGNSFTTTEAGICFINVGANTRAGDPWSGNYTLAIVITTPQPER